MAAAFVVVVVIRALSVVSAVRSINTCSVIT
jgi:hypothetical protein